MVQLNRTFSTGRPNVTQPVQTNASLSPIGQAIEGIGANIVSQAEKEEKENRTMQTLDIKNRVKSFSNSSIISLKESPNDLETINSKERLLREWDKYSKVATRGIKDKKTLALINQSIANAKVDYEFSVDNALVGKRKLYNQSVFYDTLNSLQERYVTAETPQEIASVTSDLGELLNVNTKAGIITPKELNRVQNDFKEKRKEKFEKMERLRIFNDASKGKLPLDPTDTEHMKAINENYDELLVENPEEAQQVGFDTAVNTGIVPKTYKRQLISTVLNGSPSDKIDAVRDIQDMIDVNPTLESQFSPQVKALVKGITKRIQAGVLSTDAVKFTEKEIKDNKSADRILREAEFAREFGTTEQSKKTAEHLEDIQDELEGGFLGFGKKEVSREMVSQYRMLMKDYYLNNGVDFDTAEEMAREKILGEWTVTNIGQRRYERFSPEKFYPAMNGDHEWIKSQALQLVRKHTVEDISSNKLNDQIVLKAIDDSIISGKPKYNILRRMDNGLIDSVRGSDNMPLEFQPKMEKVEEYQKQSVDRDKLLGIHKMKMGAEKRKRDIEGRTSIKEGL